jgi:hypothetical protein
MESIKFVIILFVGVIALFLVAIGWRRGMRFNRHDYQGARKERFRDNFVSSFTIISSLCCLVLVFFRFDLWGSATLFYLFYVLLLTPSLMTGLYWFSFLTNGLIINKIPRNVYFWQKYEDISALEWYEYFPFAFVGGWFAWFLAHLFLLANAGYKKIPEVVPAWIILSGFGIGALFAVIVTLGIYWTFKKRKQML